MRHDINLEKVKNKRKEKGITQQQMAEKLGYKGANGYNNLETGKYKITLETAKQIADILDEDLHSLFFKYDKGVV